MNVGDVWDWDFMWSVFRNFMATGSPFVMIVVAVAVMGMLLGAIVGIVIKARRG
ncbi:PTS ascorbate transporter subunit IIC [Paenibacillus ehimensis]|uniref:PTS ascorbate transporter subunit IIC n=1 Tax=Paenibacillus ehimensis TaxID=79264 RepID=UPI000FD840F6|nr:PTS ascorbate transporter subunit IIC [Paenibacillus ehimensis]